MPRFASGSTSSGATRKPGTGFRPRVLARACCVIALSYACSAGRGGEPSERDALAPSPVGIDVSRGADGEPSDAPILGASPGGEDAFNGEGLVEQDFVDELAEAPEAEPVDESDACAEAEVRTELVRDPVDIIMIVDNSGSMSAELEAVEKHVNDSFARILANAGSDYHLILITDHRRQPPGALQTAVCIESPLSGTPDCSAAPQPTFTDRFFQYSTLVQSGDSLEILLDTYAPPFVSELRQDRYGNAPGGWSEWVRPGVRKVIVEMTDDDSDLSPEDFMSEFFQQSPDDFVEAGDPDFVLHSVVGLEGKTESGVPYLSSEDVQEQRCSEGALIAASAGSVYQRLSPMTDGLRFSICDVESFDAVFEQIAGDVVVDSVLQCDFEVPRAPSGQVVDRDRVAINVRTGGAQATLGQVVDPGDCGPDAFYLDEDSIHLCSETCNAVQGDALAEIDVLFACESQIIVR